MGTTCLRNESSSVRLLQPRILRASRVRRIPIPAGVTHRLVRGYLMHFGYAHTLSVFDSAAGSTPDSAEVAGCRCGNS